MSGAPDEPGRDLVTACLRMSRIPATPDEIGVLAADYVSLRQAADELGEFLDDVPGEAP